MNIKLFKFVGRLVAFGIVVTMPALQSTASAQSMSPMLGKVNSFSDQFAVRVYPANPYKHRIRMEVRVYDQHFNPVRARVSPAQFTLGGNVSRSVNVIVPFDGNDKRKVRICTEAVPFPLQRKSGSVIKAKVCGKFLGVKVN